MPELPLSAIMEWDALNWGKAMRFWEETIPESLSGWRALEVGARHGGLSLYLAKKGCEVVCTDLQGPTPQAKTRHAEYGVSDRIAYAAVDVTRIPFAENTFHIVIFKSLLGEVGWDGDQGRQQRAIDEIWRVLRPKGLLLFAENLRGSAVHMFFRRVFVPWGSRWRYVSVEEMRRFTGKFTSFAYRTYGYWGAFGRSEMQRRLLHVLDVAMNPLLPETSKYILFGCAAK